MIVCIAEKPSVAKEIAYILGAKTRHDGYFEGNGYQVTFTFGHLCTLFEPHDYKPHWKSWDLNNLPMLPEKFKTKVVANTGIKKQFSIVKKLLNNASEVINCGDAGQEGELIQRWVINLAGYNGEIKRLWISSLTSEAIKEGFNNLSPSKKFDNLYYAGFSRAIGDWLLGINATRLYTVKYGGYKQVLSVGRVQTPTLAMLVKRQKEIENFVPKSYWELHTIYKKTSFHYEKGKFFDKNKGERLANLIKEKEFEIVSVDKKEGNEYAPKLFDLTGLQVYCNNKFGFTAEETLKIAQKLYELKVITYPRVDTTFLPNDVYHKIKSILSKLTNYANLTNVILQKKIKKTSRVFNDKKVTDHHAIIPTGVQIKLPYNQQQVYDIITKRFIAAFYDDCKVSNTSVKGKVDTIIFKTTGKQIVEKGWRIVFDSEKENKQQNILPDFKIGEKGKHKPSFIQKETKPPNYYTEASLLRAMETAGKQVDDEEMRDLLKENGIGRPSTRANIIETLFRRNYIVRKKKQIHATPVGVQLVNTISNKLLKSAELTGQWEKQLKEIERGNYNPSLFIKNMGKMVDQLVYEVRKENKHIRISKKQSVETQKKVRKIKSKGILNFTCPKCKKGKIVKGKKAYGCSGYNNGCNFILPFLFYDKKISENQYVRLINKGCTVNLKGFKKDNSTVEGLIRFDQNFNLLLEEKSNKVKTDQTICPKCGKGTILKGKKAFGCSNYKNGCDFVYSFEKIKSKTKGKNITKELIYKILHD